MRVALVVLASSLVCAIYLTKVASFSSRTVIKITALNVAIPIFLVFIAWKIENSRANHMADHLALIEYQDPNKVLTVEAAKRILSNENLLESLSLNESEESNTQRQILLNVFLDRGIRDLNIFNCFIDHLSDIPKQTFLKLLKIDHYPFIEYVLIKKKIIVSAISEPEQRDLWLWVSPQIIRLLHQHGFNVEAKGDDGQTALSKWAKTPGWKINKYIDEQMEFIEAMLDCNAVLTMEHIATTEKDNIVNPVLVKIAARSIPSQQT